MTLVIGTDEAGYGPNLGPLVVAASAWHVAGDPAAVERRLEDAAADARSGAGPLWGDSKRIYRAGAGLAALEEGVLVAAAMAGAAPSDWPGLAALFGAAAVPPGAGPPERDLFAALTLPRHRHEPDCRQRAAAVAGRLAALGVSLVALRCRVVQPREFNDLLDGGLNKSDVLSQCTLDLAAALTDRGQRPGGVAVADRLLVWCDRHGGRRRYAPLVSRSFAAPLVQVIEETADRSAYHLPGRDCRIEFCVGGEARLPVALASMTAKYVRELAMHAFNEFWTARQPGLAPTAGYPVDAARWRREAGAAVTAAGCDWRELWRRA
jgi:hypothetical protein